MFNFWDLFFYYQLKFNVHIDYVRNKCSKELNILKFISGIKWGAELSTLISLYKNLICSHIDYSFFVFAPKTDDKTGENSIRSSKNCSRMP